MYRRRRRQLSVQGILFVAIFIFIVIAIIVPAVRVLAPPAETPKPVEVTFEKPDTVNVLKDGELIEMDLEEYLVGVVAAEMPASYELEALKAQAVAARTYTLYKKNHGGCDNCSGADICTDSTHCQAFMTKEKMETFWGDDAEMYKEKIKLAVSETKGEVLYYEGDEIQVFYHASSGGQTENSENVYSQALPYLKSVTSEGEEDYSGYYGKVAVSKEEFISIMEKYSPGINLCESDLDNMAQTIQRFDSGRVESIKIGNQTFTGREIRKIFSLKSTNFRIDVASSVTFTTLGHGHGVGMSQTGAHAMAKNGATYIEILKHYFTGVDIK